MLTAPAGLYLGGMSPEEIALSILAEIVQMRKTKTAWVEQKEIAGGELAKSEAKDPVCGMDVNPASAKHKRDHGGKTYYFCCQQCADKFGGEPQRYLSGLAFQ